MKYFYCKSWFRAKKVVTEMLSCEAARIAHTKGQPYTVLVDCETRPTAFIEVTKNFVSVGFLDENLRENLSYAFDTVDDGKVFLSMATYRDFQGDTDTVESGSCYIFRENGAVSIKRQTFSPATSEVANGVTDVSGNYASYPAFGRYEQLLKVER